MRIKIIRAQNKIFWYSGHIGEKFTVTGSDKVNYYTGPGATMLVLKSDCRPITLGKRQTQAANTGSPKLPPLGFIEADVCKNLERRLSPIVNINDAVAVLDELCGQQGLYSVAWKMIRTRLYEEVQKPAYNQLKAEILPDFCEGMKYMNERDFIAAHKFFHNVAAKLSAV